MPIEIVDGNHNPKLNLPTSSEPITEPLKNVVRFEADSNYSKVFFSSRPPVFVARTLGVFDNLLKHFSFLRIHHKHLVNRDHITRFDENENVIEVSDGSNLPVSRRKKDEFLKKFQ
jgi:two-component system, LytTR family, response regulator